MTSIQEYLEEALNLTIADIKRRHVAAGQKVTGRTMNALEARVRAEGNRYIGEIWGRPFTGALETGSAPARKRGTEEERQRFIKQLAEWCRMRGFPEGGLTDEQYERAAKWLKWYIGKYGSRLYRSGGRQDIITPALQMLSNLMTERLSLYYNELMSETIDNNFFKGRR